MELYEKIRNIREQKEIKQKDMAKYLHMQPSTYNAYENGKRTISADLLKNICIFLNVSSDDLLDLNIKDSYLSLNKENSQIINKVKKALILSIYNSWFSPPFFNIFSILFTTPASDISTLPNPCSL